MASIIIDTVYSKLQDASAKALRNVDDELAVPVEGAEFSEAYRKGLWDGYKRFFSMQTHKFPTGLS